MPRRPRVLFLCARYPFPPWRGDQLRAFHLIRCLSAHADVRVVCFGDRLEPFPVPGVQVRVIRPSPAGRLAANGRHPSPALPLQVRLFLDRRMERAVAEEVERWGPDVLHVTLSRMAPYMTAPQAIHRHLDLVDSMALNMRARSRASRGPARAVFSVESRLAQRYEARVGAAADSVSVVAERDRAEPGLEGAVVIPNGVDSDAFSYEEPDARPPTVLFFGNLGYFHNIRPATFLADEVVGRLRRAYEGASLLLAGARPAASVRRLAERDGVVLLPDPPEMAPVLHSAAVVAIPMFSGSGMKNKVLEAFCAGTPVVANAAGIEGIDEAVPGEHFLLAEGATATAEAIEGLLRNPAERVRLARAARDLAAEHYSWERAAERMLEAYGRSAAPRV